VLVGLLAPALACAATYYVDSDWTNNPGGGTAANPYNNISNALAVANAADGNTLLVAGGVYRDAAGGGKESFPATGYVIRAAMTIRGGYAGWDGTNTFDWTTWAPRSAVLDLTNTASRALYLGVDKAVTIEGLTFLNAVNTNAGAAAYLMSAAGLIVRNCLFTNNVNLSTANSGGALFLGDSWTTGPKVLDSDFVGNRSAASGGAIYLMPYYSSSTLLISNCLFDANVASSDGGAVALNDAYQSGIA
jgi:hypothetical protein